MKKITRPKKDATGAPAPYKDPARKAGVRRINLKPHDPNDKPVVGALPPEPVPETETAQKRIKVRVPKKARREKPLKTKIKPRVPKRKRTVVPPHDPVQATELEDPRFHVEPEDRELLIQLDEDAMAEEARDGVDDVVDLARQVGRPTAWDPKFIRVAQVMAKIGATDREIADAMGVTDRTFYRWRGAYPEFCQALEMGKKTPDDRVERSLYMRAVGYSFESEQIGFYQGSVTRAKTIEHVPPDPKAAQYWLNNRRPKKWRNRQEITGANGKPLMPKTKHQMTREELMAIAQGKAPGKGKA